MYLMMNELLGKSGPVAKENVCYVLGINKRDYYRKGRV